MEAQPEAVREAFEEYNRGDEGKLEELLGAVGVKGGNGGD